MRLRILKMSWISSFPSFILDTQHQVLCWKSFSFSIFKELLHCLLVSSVEKADVILVLDPLYEACFFSLEGFRILSLSPIT